MFKQNNIVSIRDKNGALGFNNYRLTKDSESSRVLVSDKIIMLEGYHQKTGKHKRFGVLKERVELLSAR